MGAWSFMRSRLGRSLGDTIELTQVSRWESGSPATGSKEVSDLERADLLNRALA